MTVGWQIAILVTGAYLFGSIPVGLIVSRLKGVDIRRHGSGNAGATNVGRVIGRKWGVLVFLLDASKGALTTIAAGLLMLRVWDDVMCNLGTIQRDWILLGVGLGCIVGNIAPVYVRFRGGKAVATSLGVILGIYPYLTLPGLAAALLWAIVVMLTRYVSLGSVLAACVLPVAFVVYAWRSTWSLGEHYPLFCLCVGLAVLVLVRHRANIGRLLAGTENKVGAGVTKRVAE